MGADYFGDDCVFFTQPDYRLHVCHHDPRMRPGGVNALQLAHTSADWYQAKPNDLKCSVELPEAQRPCPQERITLVFMDGFAARPQLRSIRGGDAVRRLVRGISYGSPALFARLEAATELINRSRCFCLDVGSPQDTASLLIDYAGRPA
jgi:hypothetical protein